MMPVMRKPLSEPPVSWQPEVAPEMRDTRPDFKVPGVPLRGRLMLLVDRALAAVGLQRMR